MKSVKLLTFSPGDVADWTERRQIQLPVLNDTIIDFVFERDVIIVWMLIEHNVFEWHILAIWSNSNAYTH